MQSVKTQRLWWILTTTKSSDGELSQAYYVTGRRIDLKITSQLALARRFSSIRLAESYLDLLIAYPPNAYLIWRVRSCLEDC